MAAAVRVVRFERLLRLTKEAPRKVRERIQELAGLVGLRRCPTVLVVPGVVSPLLWAPGRSARLLLPAKLWARLDEGQRDSLLVHELSHLRRGGHWVRRLELLALRLYWWYPVAWWARRQLQDAEECCCDARVAAVLPGSGPAYAAALVETVTFLSAGRAAVPLGASGGGRVRHLKRRLNMILQDQPARPARRLAAALALGVGALLLALTPGSAQPPATGTTADPRALAPPPGPGDPNKVEQLRAGTAEAKARASSDGKPQCGRRVADNTRAEQIEAARDDVELQEGLLKVKLARVAAAKFAVESARPGLQRAETMFKRNAIGVEDFEKVKNDLPTRELEVQIREAEPSRRAPAPTLAPRTTQPGSRATCRATSAMAEAWSG
jgi:hypothetical protein